MDLKGEVGDIKQMNREEAGRESKTGDRRGLLVMKEKIKLACEPTRKSVIHLLFWYPKAFL